MRFIPINSIRDGMILGEGLYGKNGVLLLNSGAIMNKAHISKIREFGYNGIYVIDDLSAEIEMVDVIHGGLRRKVVKAVKEVFTGLESGKAFTDRATETIYGLVHEVIDSMLEHKDLMVNMIDLKVFDDYTYYHSVNVSVLSLLLGVALSLDKNKLFELGLSSILHDIGKVFIPKELLNKPGRHTDIEADLMKSHAYKGYEYLKERFDIPAASYLGILHHHERFDGSGYPAGIYNSKISLFGKIIAIADVYDALTSDRPYRKAVPPSEAIEYIMGGNNSLFDPKLVSHFVQRIAPYPVGTLVTLSNGTEAIVTDNNRHNCLRPKVKVIRQDNEDMPPYYLDLWNDLNTLDIVITGLAAG